MAIRLICDLSGAAWTDQQIEIKYKKTLDVIREIRKLNRKYCASKPRY